MEAILMFVSIVVIVFGILQIILFFKIWGMTDNVGKIKDMLESRSFNSPVADNEVQANDRVQDDPLEEIEIPNDINVGDRITRLSDGKEMIVDSIKDGKYFCKASRLEGYKYYKREEISI